MNSRNTLAMHILEGTFVANVRIAIAAARWNKLVVDRLLEGTLDGLRRHGVSDDRITVVWCPGSFELPLVVQTLARSSAYDAVIALGCVIRGETAHFDFVAQQAASGIQQAALSSSVPCIFGVLTTDTLEQALDRAGGKAGNKGYEAALAALEMTSLMAHLRTTEQ